MPALNPIRRLRRNAVSGRVQRLLTSAKEGTPCDRVDAIRALWKLGRADLRPAAAEFVELLGDVHKEVVDATMVLLTRLGTIEGQTLQQHKDILVAYVCSDSREARAAAVDVICKHPSILLNARAGASKNTPLHMAAKGGYLNICQRLVRTGALINLDNQQRYMPIDLARQSGHRDIVDFLQTRQNPFTTVGGNGDALTPALADKRPIIRVDWYTIPLPGLYGSMGAVHSLLAVMVGETEDSSRTFVIEKAATVRASVDFDSVMIKNGVHVSHWLDVAPIIGDNPIHSLDSKHLNPDVRFETIWRLAVDLGPYTVVGCNCHHAAIAIFNACATAQAQVDEMPNELLINLAWFFGGLGAASFASVASLPASIASVPVASMPLAHINLANAGVGCLDDIDTSRTEAAPDTSRSLVLERTPRHPCIQNASGPSLGPGCTADFWLRRSAARVRHNRGLLKVIFSVDNTMVTHSIAQILCNRANARRAPGDPWVAVSPRASAGKAECSAECMGACDGGDGHAMHTESIWGGINQAAKILNGWQHVGAALGLPDGANCWRKDFRSSLSETAFLVQLVTEQGITDAQWVEKEMARLEGCEIYNVPVRDGQTALDAVEQLVAKIRDVLQEAELEACPEPDASGMEPFGITTHSPAPSCFPFAAAAALGRGPRYGCSNLPDVRLLQLARAGGQY